MKVFLELCRERASVRAFAPERPTASVIDYIVECVRLAPSAVNKQPWRLFYVTRPELLVQLQTTYDRAWFATAPAVFVVCKDEREQWVRPSDECPHGDIDIAIATEHLCLAAAEKGLGTCWVCNFDVEACRKILGLNKEVTPVVMVPIGRADEAFVDHGRRRKETKEILTCLE